MKNVLFVCIENSCRSQMAEGIAKILTNGAISFYSAGSKPLGEVNNNAIRAMEEIGIDISNAKSKGFNNLPTKAFDYAVTLGCKDICPFISADKHIHWDIADPKGKDIDAFRKARDEIKEKVNEFVGIILKENRTT